MATTLSFSGAAARLRQFMARCAGYRDGADDPIGSDDEFNTMALDLFGLQFEHNAAYQRWCIAEAKRPGQARHWTEIPAMPTAAFKEMDVTSLAASERTSVFHSSGTTGQKASRHFHSAESIALYEASLLTWFRKCVLPDGSGSVSLQALTPPPDDAPNSSLVQMFETLRRDVGASDSAFHGFVDSFGAWSLKEASVEERIGCVDRPVLLLGTAFSYVNWLDHLAAEGRILRLPAGSRVLETGGYKGRSRVMPKEDLHRLMGERLGVGRDQILCEYGMSELSSQAYDVGPGRGARSGAAVAGTPASRRFQFPPWVRVRLLAPETGREVRDGETGLVRVLDLANLWSVAAVQTEDLAIRRGCGFELVGRATTAEVRGCSLMPASR